MPQVKTLTVNRISSSIDRFKSRLSDHFEAQEDSTTGQGEILRCKVPDLVRQRYNLTLRVFDSDKITVQGTSGLPDADFNKTAKGIENLALESCFSVASSLRLTRAKLMLEHMKTLKISHELDRIAAILFSETVAELLICERLELNSILNGPLRKAGVPQKIEALENRFGKVYRSKDILSLYDIRNGVAHEGQSVNEKETGWAIELVEDLARVM